MLIKEKLRDFVIRNFYVPDASVLQEGDSLLDGGIVDSTGVLEIIDFIESEFKIVVEDQEMVPENLDSIANITAFIVRKTA